MSLRYANPIIAAYKLTMIAAAADVTTINFHEFNHDDVTAR